MYFIKCTEIHGFTIGNTCKDGFTVHTFNRQFIINTTNMIYHLKFVDL